MDDPWYNLGFNDAYYGFPPLMLSQHWAPKAAACYISGYSNYLESMS